MAFQLDATAIAHVSMNPAVRDAAAVGAGLIELWPLADAKQMDNDTKYGENLQVRMTRMAARVMTGDDVTVPDAEFVYEGADEIPGRPQRIVDALLAANDAYDEMGDYSETGDTRLIMRGAGQLGVDWDDDTVHAIAEALEAIEQAIGMGGGAAGGADAAGAAAPANAAPSADVEAIAQRFATVTVAADGLLRLIDLCKPCTETVQHMLQIISAIFHICHNSSTNHHLFCCDSAYLITYTTVICNLFISSLFYQL